MARPLSLALQDRGLTFWLDELEIRLGDSLRQKIDEGLRTSKFGVVIVSPSFFKKRWTQWELDGLADREMTTGTKVVLPIWHRVDHDDVATYSPSLANKHASRTSDGIEHVANEIAEVLQAPAAAAPLIDRVPRTPEEQAALLLSRPSSWEHLLFASILRRRKEALEPKYRDHELRFVRPVDGLVLDDSAAAEFLAAAFRQSGALLANLDRLFDSKAQELAFGAPGEPGDPARIEHLALRVTDIYEGLLDWAARLRGTTVPSRFERALELSSSFVDGPIRQFREFVDRSVAEVDRVPALLREKGARPITIEISLALSIDDWVRNELQRELKRLQ